MKLPKPTFLDCLAVLLIISLPISGCMPQSEPVALAMPGEFPPAESPVVDEPAAQAPQVTPFPTRPAYSPGELIDYTVQSGDTLPALAVHFNTRVEEIRECTSIPA